MQYAERIDNADELLETFLETFEEEDPAVQLQLLTATVKCFLKSPEDTQELVQRVLDMATEESDNPDLRDRGFIYWRLLSTDPEAAKMVVLGDKPVIEDDTFRLEPSLLNVLIGQVATLSSVYHKPPEAFVVRRGQGAVEEEEEEEDEEEEYEGEHDVGDSNVDLLDMGALNVNDNASGASSEVSFDSCVSNRVCPLPLPLKIVVACVQYEIKAPLNKVCSPDKSGGLEVYSGFRRYNNTIRMEFEIHNISSAVEVSSMAIQLNKNAFGLSPVNQQIICNPPVAPGSKGSAYVEMAVNPNMLTPLAPGQPVSPQVQVAIKNMHSGSVFYFAVNFNFEAFFTPDGAMDRAAFIESWKSIDDRNELFGTVPDLMPASVDIEQVQAKFKANNVFFIARRPVPNAEGQEVVYFSMRTPTGMEFLAELTFKQGLNACKVCIKTENIAYGPLVKTALESLLVN